MKRLTFLDVDPELLKQLEQEALSHLTPKETDGLDELTGLCKSHVPNPLSYDSILTLLRFLRANKFNAQNALQQYKKTLEWRAANRVNSILEEMEAGVPAFDKHSPTGYFGEGREGHPIYYIRNGYINMPKLSELVGREMIVRRHIWNNEHMEWRAMQSVIKNKRLVDKHVAVIDMRGALFRMDSLTMGLYKENVEIDQLYYPDSLLKMVVVYPHWIVKVLFGMVSLWMDSQTKSRVQIIPGDPASFLQQIADPSEIPEEYGGTATYRVPGGPGISPDSAVFYDKDANENEKESDLGQMIGAN